MSVVADDSAWDLGPAPLQSAADSDGEPPEDPYPPQGSDAGTPAAAPTPAAPTGVPPTARRVFDGLLTPPVVRPVAPSGLAEDLRAILAPYAAEVAKLWPEPSLRIGKSQITSITRCEGTSLASRNAGFPDTIPIPVAVGQVVHKSVQMLWTHPGRTLPEYVRAGISGAAAESDSFAALWDGADMAVQSDVIARSVSRLASFADTFPPLLDEWAPRFEEPVSARVGALVLVGRPDFMLGRPRPDGSRTMVVCDIKSGELGEDHRFEALLYALLLTLRHGVPPWRSTVLSLASGDWTDPDFTAEDLHTTAERAGAAAAACAAVWSDARTPTLSPGPWCRWCPARATCPSAQTPDR